MSDYTWDQVDVEESITASDQKQSDSLDVQTPVGKLLCSVAECVPVEKNFDKYTCMAAKLKMKINGLVKLEQPLLNADGTPVKREGEIVMKVQDIPAEKKSEYEALFLGQFIFDEILLFHPKEKEATKRRRLFVAKKLGLITPSAQSIGSKEWAGAPGKDVIVTTEWNAWKDKNTGDLKRNVKVGWSGYEFATDTAIDPIISNPYVNDFSGI
jgi:hypothetical protein